mgnify:CR=1 FL=1
MESKKHPKMKLNFVLLYSGLFVAGRRQRNGNRRRRNECYDPANLQSYVGQLSETIGGYTCQKWNAASPHRPKYRPSSTNNNYCRNPGNT